MNFLPENEGKDHINIYSQSKLELGKMLSNFYHCSVETMDGHFESVEAYWAWLSIEDCDEKECLRKCYGFNAKKIGKELGAKYAKRIDDDFEHKISMAIWYKIKKNCQMFLSNPLYRTLPIVHYYNFGGKVVDVSEKYKWMVDNISKMRDLLWKKYDLKNEKENFQQ